MAALAYDRVATARLSARELQVLWHVAGGAGRKHLAHVLRIRIGTLRAHLQTLRLKLGLADERELVIYTLMNPAIFNPASGGIGPRGLHPEGCPCDSPFCRARRESRLAVVPAELAAG